MEDGLKLISANNHAITYHEPQIGFISSWTGEALRQTITADYWKPHETKMNFPEGSILIKPQNNWRELLQTMAQLYLKGIPIDWKGFDKPYNRKNVPLPTYPFQRERYWMEAAATQKKSRLPENADPLLGELIPLPSKDILFRNEIDLNLLNYLQDHIIFNTIIFPGAGYAEILQHAARILFHNQKFTIKNLSFEQPLTFDVSKTKMIELYAKPKDDGYAVSIYSIENQNWTLHAKGELLSSTASPQASINWNSLRSICNEVVDVDSFYKQIDSIGANLGKKFQTLKKIWVSNNDVIAEIEGEAIPGLDGSFQTLFLLKKDPSVILPVGIEKISCFSEIEPSIRIHVKLKQMDENNIKTDIDVFSLEGKPILQISGFHMRKTNQSRLEKMLTKEAEVLPWLYQIIWEPKPLEVTNELKSPWTIISDKEETIDGLESNRSSLKMQLKR